MIISPAYVSPCGSAIIWHADALDVLAQLQPLTINATITDPPYSSGGAFRGDRMQSTADKYEQSGQRLKRRDFTGDNRDQRSFAYWCDLWLRRCRDISTPGAPICAFADWRQLPTLTDAVQAAGFVWRGVTVWDKTEGARPQMGRFRAQAEYIAWGSNGPMPADPSVGVLPGVYRFPVLQRDKHHLTGKPSDLMTNIVRICRPNGVVLDPFMGSGSTAVGCIRAGRKFIGCDVDPDNVAITIERVEKELAARGQVHEVAA